MKKDNFTVEKVLAVSIAMAQNTANDKNRGLSKLRLAENPKSNIVHDIIYMKPFK